MFLEGTVISGSLFCILSCDIIIGAVFVFIIFMIYKSNRIIYNQGGGFVRIKKYPLRER